MAPFTAAFAQLAYCPFNRSDVAAVLRRAIVITEKTTDAETATNRTIPRLTSDTVDEFVAEPLMRPLGVVSDCSAQPNGKPVFSGQSWS